MCSKWVANYWTNHDRLTTSTKGQKVKGSCMINQDETIWFPLDPLSPIPYFSFIPKQWDIKKISERNIHLC